MLLFSSGELLIRRVSREILQLTVETLVRITSPVRSFHKGIPEVELLDFSDRTPRLSRLTRNSSREQI